MLLLATFSFMVALSMSEPVNFCREAKDCQTCASSYTHVLGFREHCRWCVESKLCVGPLSCPLGKPVVQRDSFRCPAKASVAKGKRYTDELGRSLYAFILSLRDENVTACLLNVRPDVSHIRTFTVECDTSGNTCSSMVAVSEEAKSIYLVFRDTASRQQLITEMVNGLGAQLGAWEKFEGDAGVVSYFHTAFYKTFVDSGMKDHALSLVKKYPGFRVWMTGYSLGGSLASMTAVYLAKKKLVDSDSLRLLTFGEPRTGNVAFAKEVEENVPFRYRVVKRNDFVTSIPRSVDPAASLITATAFERQPLFYRFLVHYNNSMKKGDKFK
ncbi:Triacylglycerol lipase, partial [Trichostrongylus colubriformis]